MQNVESVHFLQITNISDMYNNKIQVDLKKKRTYSATCWNVLCIICLTLSTSSLLIPWSPIENVAFLVLVSNLRYKKRNTSGSQTTFVSCQRETGTAQSEKGTVQLRSYSINCRCIFKPTHELEHNLNQCLPLSDFCKMQLSLPE